MTWERNVVRRTMEGAGDFPGVQLELLLRRLESCPAAMPAIIAAIGDMGAFFHSQAAALEAEGRRRNGGAEIITLQK